MEENKLGIRKFSDSTQMMAGYYSHFTHSTVFDLLSRTVPPGSTVADIGAGEGAFSERLFNNGYKVIAIENFCDFKVDQIELHKLNLNEQWSVKISDKVDAVVGIEIIEHIENPFHFLRQVRNIIKSNGIVFISTPNVLNFESRFKLFMTGKLEMMNHPDHRTPIFPETMARYCIESGFEIVNKVIDIDTLSVKGKTFKGKVLRIFARFLRKFIKDDYKCGNSNVWILKPSSAAIYVPPPHA